MICVQTPADSLNIASAPKNAVEDFSTETFEFTGSGILDKDMQGIFKAVGYWEKDGRHFYGLDLMKANPKIKARPEEVEKYGHVQVSYDSIPVMDEYLATGYETDDGLNTHHNTVVDELWVEMLLLLNIDKFEDKFGTHKGRTRNPNGKGEKL